MFCTAVASSTAGALAQAPDLQAPHHPEQLLVRFKASVSLESADTIHSALGAERLNSYRHVSGLQLVKVPQAGVADALNAYLNRDDVLYAEPDYEVQINATIPDDTKFNLLWGLNNTGQVINGVTGTAGADICASEAWDYHQGDQTYQIAVIDTGIAYTHPDLYDVTLGQNNIWTNPNPVEPDGNSNGYADDLHGYNFVDAYTHVDPWDDNVDSHGTHVSGTIGAIGDNTKGVAGVNWKCSMIALKTFDPIGFGYVSDIVEAMDYVIDNNIPVSNNSYSMTAYSTSLYNVIQSSKSIGHIFVTAAGNSNSDNDTTSRYPCSFNLSNIICVAATNNKDERAWFSNYGETTVDLGAPGVDVQSTILTGWPQVNPNYGYLSGTSMATPHVTGVVALVRTYFPSNMSWQNARDRVLESVRLIDALGGDPPKTVTGGVVNAFWAIKDCNDNGRNDDEDIVCGGGNTCNGEDGSYDCNTNNLPDDCEVNQLGTSEDCDSDGVPDECDPPSYACCDSSGRCSTKTRSDCETAGGTYACGLTCAQVQCESGS